MIGRDETQALDIRLGLADAFGKARDRHANVGRQGLAARIEALDRPIAVVARLPDPAAILLALGPIEADGAFALGDLLEAGDLVAHRDLGAVKLQEQRGPLVEIEFRMLVDGRDQDGVDSSARARPSPSWIDWMTAFTAPSRVSNGQTAAMVDSGMP